jgi:hypothetical protein
VFRRTCVISVGNCRSLLLLKSLSGFAFRSAQRISEAKSAAFRRTGITWAPPERMILRKRGSLLRFQKRKAQMFNKKTRTCLLDTSSKHMTRQARLTTVRPVPRDWASKAPRTISCREERCYTELHVVANRNPAVDVSLHAGFGLSIGSCLGLMLADKFC